MTAVTAPPTAASLAPTSLPPVPGGKNAAPADNTLPADFASMLKVLQVLSAESDGLNGTLAKPDAGLLADSAPPDDLEGSDPSGGIDIAAMLGQINAAAPTAAPALPPGQGNRPSGPFTPGGEEAARGISGKGQETANTLLPAQLAGDPAGLESGEAKPDFVLPETPAADQASLRSSELNPARGPQVERAKLEVATPVHAPNWSSEVGQRVVWMARNNIQEAQLSVNPPQLGPIEITLSLQDNNASARFFSPHAEVREVLEQAMPRLREMLAGAGVQLGQSDVGAQSQQAFQQFSGRSGGGHSGDPSFSEQHPSLRAPGAVNQAVAVRTLKGNGLVDTFV